MEKIVSYYGQCFLCCRDLILRRTTDLRGNVIYVCPKCGGMNSPERIEACRDFRGFVHPEYGPMESVE